MDTHPYRVLVSELMLQQTQVKTVIPYYHRFLKLFPSAAKLAAAEEQEVLAAWAGLGYYRRARFLQAAAKAVTAAGKFPRDAEGLKALPGVGSYTAAAVGSISFGLPLAVVDGNVIRVVARLLAMEDNALRGPGRKKVEEAAQAMLDFRRPGDFNQAMMELGATLCTPAAPACLVCPLREHCRGFATGQPEQFPKLPKPAQASSVRKAVALVLKDGEVLMAQRGSEGRMEGFWHFPEREVPAKESIDCAAVLAAAAAATGGLKLKAKAGGFRHTITRYRIEVEAFNFEAKKSATPKEGWRWIALKHLKTLPLASAERRLAAMLG